MAAGASAGCTIARGVGGATIVFRYERDFAL
jgi:hypothetical protein